METEIKVSKLEHEELVDLLSTGLYGSSWFGASYDRKAYESLADMLLAGHNIVFIDYYAAGESHSNKCVENILRRYTTVVGSILVDGDLMITAT